MKADIIIRDSGKVTEIKDAEVEITTYKGFQKEDKTAIIVNVPSKEILDEEEKAYLSAVIKPFRSRVLYVMKNSFLQRGSSYSFN